MGRYVAKPPVPNNKKFFECKEIGPEPALNKEGFWKKYVIQEDKYNNPVRRSRRKR
jgi:hypothetical protein